MTEDVRDAVLRRAIKRAQCDIGVPVVVLLGTGLLFALGALITLGLGPAVFANTAGALAAFGWWGWAYRRWLNWVIGLGVPKEEARAAARQVGLVFPRARW